MASTFDTTSAALDPREDWAAQVIQSIFPTRSGSAPLQAERPGMGSEQPRAAERLLIGMINNEAAKMRELLEDRPPPDTM